MQGDYSGPPYAFHPIGTLLYQCTFFRSAALYSPGVLLNGAAYIAVARRVAKPPGEDRCADPAFSGTIQI